MKPALHIPEPWLTMSAAILLSMANWVAGMDQWRSRCGFPTLFLIQKNGTACLLRKQYKVFKRVGALQTFKYLRLLVLPLSPPSIVMTTCSTFFALGMMPLLLYIYTKGIYDGDLKDKVPYVGIMISLVMILIPCTMGIILKSKWPKYGPYIIKVRIMGPCFNGALPPHRTDLDWVTVVGV